jgi:protein-S-isoprenylcysteine O-methyltransferase Ste14
LESRLQQAEAGTGAQLGTLGGHNRLLDTCLDWSERLLILALFGWLVVRLATNSGGADSWASLLLLPSEGLVVVFVLIRRPSRQMSRHVGEWLLALAATCAPLLVSAGADMSLVPAALGGLLLLAGIIVQVHAKITLGRSFGCVPAHRGLKLAGPYRVVRHPMYAGYLVSHLAFLAMNPTLWNLGVYAFCYGLQIPRLLTEERLLSADPAYQAYQARVRYRLIPGVF